MELNWLTATSGYVGSSGETTIEPRMLSELRCLGADGCTMAGPPGRWQRRQGSERGE